MIKGGGDALLDLIWRLYNLAFENVMPEEWRSAIIVPLYKNKGERT